MTLATTAPGAGLADLEPMRAIVGKARIVALGEGTHGTREFFHLKHRMLEYLVTRMGFGLFAIEGGMAEARRLDDYVLTGKGDPKELLRSLRFWAWNTEEVLDLVEWMRVTNRAGRHRVRFAGFDMQHPESAMADVRRFISRVDSGSLGGLDETWKRVRHAARPRMASVLASRAFPLEDAAGRKVRFSGWIRTEDLKDGRAALWWRVTGAPGEILALDSMEGRGPSGTTPWTRYEIELDVPRGGAQIRYGFLLAGSGSAWFDSLSVTLDGQPWAAEPVDFDFETPGARDAWWARSEDFEVGLDSTQAHSGRRSLRLSPAPGVADSQLAATRALLPEVRQLVARLERDRSSHDVTVPASEVDWAIQCARLVQQCLEVIAGSATRDECMARNVEWLLSHGATGTKVALWAHNAHVARQEGSLGGFLARRHGPDLVSFGFAFHEGRYNAVRDGRVQANNAVPGIAGSAEEVFHAAGLPRFLLDLRQASRRDTSAAWLDREIQFRSIGTLATDGFHLANIRRQYDAIIYVERSTPSALLP